MRYEQDKNDISNITFPYTINVFQFSLFALQTSGIIAGITL